MPSPLAKALSGRKTRAATKAATAPDDSAPVKKKRGRPPKRKPLTEIEPISTDPIRALDIDISSFAAEDVLEEGERLTLPQITVADAGDPRIYADIVESVLDEAMRPGTKLKGSRASAMIAAIETACEILTDSSLREAKRKRRNPLDNLREVMGRAEDMTARIEELFDRIDTLRPVAAERCEYAPPAYEGRDLSDGSPDAGGAAAARFDEARKQFGRVLGAINNMLSGATTGLQTKQLLTLINTACQTTVGEDLSVIAREATDAMRRVTDLLATPEAEIRVIAASYRRADGVTEQEVQRWDNLCERVIALQTLARRDSAKLAAYAGRDADPAKAGELLDIQWFQVAFHDLRNLVEFPNVLIHAHPGTGKTTHFRIGRAWHIGNQPERRMLLLLADKDVSATEVDALRKFMKTGYYRAVFPHIRILGRVDTTSADDTDKAPNKASSFCVARRNQAYARDATVSGFGATCNIEGNGYDDIEIDDPQPDRAKYEPHIREVVTRNIEGCAANRLRVAADSHIRGICTPKNSADWAGRIRSRSAAGQLPSWKVCHKVFAVKQDPTTGEFIPLWSKVATAAQLAEKSHTDSFANDYLLRDDMGGKNIVSRLCYYPADPDDPLWEKISAEFRTKALERLRIIQAGRHFLSIDPSGTRNKGSAKTAVGRFSLTEDDRLYLLRVDLLPGDPVALREWVIRQVVGDDLFDERFIHDEDEDDVKVVKRGLWLHRVKARGNLAGVVIEDTGAQSFGTSAFNRDVPSQVAEMGVEWDGTMHGFRATALLGSKASIGKEARLRECAAMLHRRYLSFPGKWRMDFEGNKVRDLVCLDNGPLCGDTASLVEQIIHFDRHRTNDGVDMVTQMLLHLAKRGLQRDIPDREDLNATGSGYIDPFREAMRKAMEDMGKAPEPTDCEREELSWCAQAFSAA